jgi:hypothetical protein
MRDFIWRIFLVLFSHWPSLPHFFFPLVSKQSQPVLSFEKQQFNDNLSNRANVNSSLTGHPRDVKTFFDMTLQFSFLHSVKRDNSLLLQTTFLP